jgi:hypothetical protein
MSSKNFVAYISSYTGNEKGAVHTSEESAVTSAIKEKKKLSIEGGGKYERKCESLKLLAKVGEIRTSDKVATLALFSILR